MAEKKKKRRFVPALVWQQTSSAPTYAQLAMREPSAYHRRNGLVIREARWETIDEGAEARLQKDDGASEIV